MESKLFGGAGTGALISYFGSEIIFLLKIFSFYYTVVSLEDARMNFN